jgi:hypothetical protein
MEGVGRLPAQRPERRGRPTNDGGADEQVPLVRAGVPRPHLQAQFLKK